MYHNIDGEVYVGYEGVFADYLGGLIDSDNDFVNLILAQKVFIPAIDGIGTLSNNKEDGLDLQHLSCDMLDKTKMYVPDDSTFPGIDYFSTIYLIDMKTWLFLGRQAKQAVKNLTSVQKQQLNEYSTSLKKLIFGKSKKNKKSKKSAKMKHEGKVQLAKDELFLCLFLSPKEMVRTWHPNKKIAQQMLWMDGTHLSRFFGPQFDLALRWTLNTAGQQKPEPSRQSTEPQRVFVNVSVVSCIESKNKNDENKNKDKIHTNEPIPSTQETRDMLHMEESNKATNENHNNNENSNNEKQENDSDEGELEDIDVTLIRKSATVISAQAFPSPPKKKRKLKNGKAANDKK